MAGSGSLSRQQKRLARIKRNVVRELLALEKELRRTKL